jgi:hypothetical protein
MMMTRKPSLPSHDHPTRGLPGTTLEGLHYVTCP